MPRSDSPERIYLEPPPGSPDTGRLWCQDDDPGGTGRPWVPYIRADRALAPISEPMLAWVYARLAAQEAAFDDPENELYDDGGLYDDILLGRALAQALEQRLGGEVP